MNGFVNGMGRREPCQLLASKAWTPESGHTSYTRCTVIQAPSDLPDGDYAVEFDGETAVAQIVNGAWLAGWVRRSAEAS